MNGLCHSDLVARELRPEAGVVRRRLGVQRVEVGLLDIAPARRIRAAARRCGSRSIPTRSWTCSFSSGGCRPRAPGPARARETACSLTKRAHPAIRALMQRKPAADRCAAKAAHRRPRHADADLRPSPDAATRRVARCRLACSLNASATPPCPSPASAPSPHVLFFSRWLQLPLYLGLIVAQAVYVWHFWVELTHLVEAAFGSQDALRADPQQRHAGRRRDGQGAARDGHHAGRARPDRRGDDLQPADHGDRRRLRDLRVAHAPRGPSRPARVAVARQRHRAQGQARDRDHRHLVDPPAEDLHQRRVLRREGADRADRDPHHVPALGAGDRRRRPHHAAGPPHAGDAPRPRGASTAPTDTGSAA